MKLPRPLLVESGHMTPLAYQYVHQLEADQTWCLAFLLGFH